MGSAAGDFNRDGFTDLVVVNALSGNYSVLLGNGSGTFLLVSNIAIGTYPHSVASADLNADGKLDLVVTAEYEVRVLLGNGDGTFSLVTVLHPGQGARFPVVADFNRDGKPDLAIAVYTGGNVSLYQGNGNGTFQSPAVYPNAYTTKILLGDFNRDGNPDVISTRGYDDGTVKVWLGTGAGTLQGGAEFPDTLQYLDAVTADFNGDGRLDLALSRGAYTDIRLGNGDGTFQNYIRQAVTGSARIVAADFNGDGIADLLSTSSTGVRLHSAHGDGTFAAGTEYPLSAWSPGPITVADLNMDGRMDAVVSNFNTGGVEVLLGFQGAVDQGGYPTRADYPVGPYATSLAVADFNRDGRDDVVSANDGGTSLTILLADADGAFPSPATYQLGSRAYKVIAADFNRDGKPDLATISPNNGPLRIILGNGDGTFQPSTAYPYQSLQGLASGDFNGDGNLDIVIAGNNSPRVSFFLGDGVGGFQNSPALDIPMAYPMSTVTVGDVNRDGRPDVVVTYGSENAIGVLLATGANSFAPLMSYPVPARQGAAIADFNRDGQPDVAVITNSGVAVLPGMGNGVLGSPFNSSTSGTSWGLALGDFNSDGKLDVAVPTCWTASILLGTGGGSFSLGNLTPGGCIHGVAVGDFNGDGRPDLAVANDQMSRVEVFLHAAPYPSSVSLSTSANPVNAGVPVTFGASAVAPLPSCMAPTGNVTFQDGATVMATVPLNGAGTAAHTTATLSGGSHSVTAAYQGNRFFQRSTSTTITQNVIVQYPTTALLTSSLNPSTFGRAVTFAATVSSTGGIPTGTVQFLDGATVLGSVPVANGTATLTLVHLAVGSHSITAIYGGNPPFLGATSNVLQQTVLPEDRLQFAYAANVGSNNISAYSVASNGALTALSGSPYAAHGDPYTIVTDPLNRFVYTANVTGNGVTGYSIQPGTGALVPIPGSPFAAGSSPHSIAIDPTGRFAFVPNEASQNISVYSIGTNGALAPVPGSPFANLGALNPFSAAVDATGRFLYVANKMSGNLTGFAINSSTGALMQIPGATVGSGLYAHNIATHPSSPFVYAVNVGSNSVTAYAIDSQTGALTAIGGPRTTAAGPHRVTVDPSGRYLYTADQWGQAVSGFQIGSDGGLIPMPGGPFMLGGEIQGTGVALGGTVLHALNKSSNTVSVWSIHTGTGVLQATGIPAAQSGNSPISIAYALVQPVAATATTLTASPSPSSYGQTVSLTATVSSPGGTPTGLVTFQAGALPLGSAMLNGGTASLNVSALAVGTHLLTASYGGVAGYAPSASAGVSHTVVKAAQTIVFPAIAAKIFGDAPFGVAASGGASGQPVVFTASGNCSIAGNVVAITGAGSCLVTASQSGDANYEAAASVTQGFAIAKAPATILLSNLLQVYDGSPRAVTIATNPAGLSSVAVAYDGGPIPPTNAGSYTEAAVLVNPNYDAPPVAALLVVADRNAPIIANLALSANPLAAGSATVATASITDVGAERNTATRVEYSLDGGQNWLAVPQGAYVDPNLNLSLTPSAGVYTVCLRATDAARNGSSACGPLLAVYDATAGFVTGGGWIQSPAGAYAANPALTGKANFGFVSKYKPGSSVPEGDTQFRFQAANLDFKSVSYEWLVVSGARAQFKGAGTINGSGDFRFMLTAIDGGLLGNGTDADKFRIRIWDNAGGGLVYDNQPGKPDTGDDATELGGGSIIIHR